MRHIDLPADLFSLAEAREVGLSGKVLARLIRDGVIVRERNGLFMQTGLAETSDVLQLHVQIAHKVIDGLRGAYALGGHTAAAALGIWTPDAWTRAGRPVCLYALDNVCTEHTTRLHILNATLGNGELVDVDGRLSVNVIRTSIDLARGRSLARALIPLDSALRLGASHDALEGRVRRMFRWPGVRSVKAALPHIDHRHESPLESWSAGRFMLQGIEPPEPQVELRGASGRAYRVDFYWRTARLVGEADGWGKFGDDTSLQALGFREEKVREDDLRAAGYRVIRWTFQTQESAAVAIAQFLARQHWRRRAS